MRSTNALFIGLLMLLLVACGTAADTEASGATETTSPDLETQEIFPVDPDEVAALYEAVDGAIADAGCDGFTGQLILSDVQGEDPDPTKEELYAQVDQILAEAGVEAFVSDISLVLNAEVQQGILDQYKGDGGCSCPDGTTRVPCWNCNGPPVNPPIEPGDPRA